MSAYSLQLSLNMSKSITIRAALRSFSISSQNGVFVTRTLHRTFTSAAATVYNYDDMSVDQATAKTMWASKMIAWQAHSYSTIDDLVLTSNARSPVMVKPKEVLVRIKASSVNPLDIMMAGKH